MFSSSSSSSSTAFPITDPFAATPSHLQFSTDLQHLPAYTPANTSSPFSSPLTSSAAYPTFLASPLDTPVYRSLDVLSPAPAFEIPRLSHHSSTTWSNDWGNEQQHSYGKKLDFTTSSNQLYGATLPLVQVNKKQLEVPCLPSHLERYSTFLSYTVPEQIISGLLSACSAHHVDYEHAEGKTKIKCIGYHNSACTQFNIYLYAGNKPNSYAVEFQRRTGCIMTFHTIYSRMLKSLGNVVIKPYDDYVSSSEYDMDHLPVPELDNMCLQESCVDVLCTMITSNDIKSTREGITVLANSTIPCDVLKAKESNIINAVVFALTSGDEESVRCASLLVSKLCTAATLSSANVSSIIKNAIQLFDSAPLNHAKTKSLYIYDTKRQLSTALAHLSDSNPNEISNYHDVLLRYHSDNDMIVKNSIQHTLSNIGITC